MTADLRQRIVRAAEGELGPGDPPKYWRSCRVAGPPFPKHWCGGFALWAIHQADVALDVAWKIGLGFCEVQRLPRTTQPKPGDVAYKDKPFQHHAVVASVSGDTVTTIDGNQPHVARRTKNLPEWTCFYSIEPLLTKAAPPSSSQPSLPLDEPSGRRVLRLTRPRMTGDDVRDFQRSAGKIAVDGVFGAQSEARAREIQQAHGLLADGVVGPKTWAKLEGR